MMNIRIFLYILLLLIVSSCANRVAPTGGEKDIEAPKLIESDPPNFSINIISGTIELKFNEYIQLKDPATQILISPLADPAPEFTVKKRSLFIELPDSLKANTTYTINFGSAIGDVHEGNEFPFQYVFSTGTVLDSLSVSGIATDALTQKGKKGVRVMLYTSEDDSLPFKRKPDYFALTDDNGNFRISNISPGTYYILALDDKNGNYTNDNIQDEGMSLMIPLSIPDTNAIKIQYFTQPSRELYIKSAIANGKGRWDIPFNRPAPNATFITSKPVLHAWSKGNDTLSVWLNDTLADSLTVWISEHSIPADTVFIRVKGRTASGRGSEVKKSLLESFPLSIIPGKDAAFRFANPILSIDTSKILFTEDTTKQKFNYLFTDSLKRNIAVQHPWKDNNTYRIIFLPGAITDFINQKNDTLDIAFAVRKITELGNVSFTIKGLDDGHYLLQLLTNDYALLREMPVTGDGTYDFTLLEPMQMKARLIADENNNGKWDTGNYTLRRNAERIYYFPAEVQSRANWDVSSEWNLLIP
jgi:hypothetical protein